MEVQFKPLGKVMSMAAATGLEITYAFDDLVFSEHAFFIIRFDKVHDNVLHLYFNIESDQQKADEIADKLAVMAQQENFELKLSGKFSVNQIFGTEEIEVKFIIN
jgi:hypothetical protein